jgi:hypothetical protein
MDYYYSNDLNAKKKGRICFLVGGEQRALPKKETNYTPLAGACGIRVCVLSEFTLQVLKFKALSVSIFKVIFVLN